MIRIFAANVARVNIKMRMKRFSLVLVILFFLILVVSGFVFRNHIRLYYCQDYSIKASTITLEEEIDESNFKVEIYRIDRTFKNRWVDRYNCFFDDELLVIYLPLNKFKFRNVVRSPIGTDELNEYATIRFNTLFFDPAYNSTTGLIDDQEIVGLKVPFGNRLAIDGIGNLVYATNLQNAEYNDVLQISDTFSVEGSAEGYSWLQYRQFLAIKDDQLIYISGNGNSLICWQDVQELMKQRDIEKILALDGGTSLDYNFEGAESNYSFSSIPFRHLWFNLNSPYYIEGELK